MIGSAPKPADEVAFEALLRAAFERAGNELRERYTSNGDVKLAAAALAYAQAVKDAKRARRTKR